MTRQVEAVYEHGVLRPLEPLSLPEQQHVLVTIAEVPEIKNEPRHAEQEWLNRFSHLYRGQWVALQGDNLISHGAKARTVRDEALRRGVDRPLLFKVPDSNELPSAGWV